MSREVGRGRAGMVATDAAGRLPQLQSGAEAVLPGRGTPPLCSFPSEQTLVEVLGSLKQHSRASSHCWQGLGLWNANLFPPTSPRAPPSAPNTHTLPVLAETGRGSGDASKTQWGQ